MASSPAYHFATIAMQVEDISSNVTDLANIFSVQRERTSLDDDFIDGIVAEANNLITAANALKDIAFSG